MKRLAALLFALCLTFGLAAPASAIEINSSGQLDWVFGYTTNKSFKDNENERFFARQRARIIVEFIASEYLRGVMQFQIGTIHWGRDGGQLDTNKTSPVIRRAYLDWKVPDTGLKFRMGLHQFALPMATSTNPFFNANAAVLQGTADITGEISASVFWGRPFFNENDNARLNNLHDNATDMFGAMLDFDYDSFSLRPWFTYTSVGNQSGFWEYRIKNSTPGAHGYLGTSDMYVGGAALKINPFKELGLKFDALYGALNNDGRKDGNNDPEGKGWLLTTLIDYDLDWGKPGLVAWYGSGDSSSQQRKGKFGRLPVLGTATGYVPTRMGGTGAFTSVGDQTFISLTFVGTWGAGAQITNMSFIDNLTHSARIAYYQGTNAKIDSQQKRDNMLYGGMGEAVYMTREDKAWEVSFDHRYNISKNLITVLELGYIHLDVDKKYNRVYDEKNSYNAQFTVRYTW